jgi:hypothetical protein
MGIFESSWHTLLNALTLQVMFVYSRTLQACPAQVRSAWESGSNVEMTFSPTTCDAVCEIILIDCLLDVKDLILVCQGC